MCCYTEDYGYQHFHNLPQLIATMKCKNYRSIDMKPNRVMISDFMSILQVNHSENTKKHMFTIGDRFRISEYDLPLRKSYKPQFTQKIFEIVAVVFQKTPTYTMKDEKAAIRGKFYEKAMIRVI